MTSTCFKLVMRIENYLYPSDVVGLSFLLSTYLLNGLLTLLERQKYHLHTSAIQFYFWMLHFVCSIPSFVKDIELLLGGIQMEDLVSALGTPFILLSFIIHCISEYVEIGNDEKTPPEDKSSHFSFISFAFMDALIWKGYKQPLLQSELPSNPRQVNVEANVDRFMAGWKTAISDKGVSMVNPTEKSVSIWPVLVKTYGWRLLVCVVLATTFTLISFANPLILDALITHVQNANDQVWKGYFYIVVLFICNLVKTVSREFLMYPAI